MITANVLGQEINVRCETVVSNSVNFLAVNFICDDAWQGYSKKAIFSNEEKTVAVVFEEGNSLIIDDGCCLVPFEVIEYPGFSLSLVGHKGDSIITTEPVFIPVKESGDIDGAKPLEPTPDQYAQIIEICAQSKQVADSVREDADNGLFKGDKGEKGDIGPIGIQGEKGEPGPQGIQGKKGDKGDKGDKGEKGDKGDKGEQGLVGLKGDKGDKGDKGEDGADYILTEADKTDIAAIVISNLTDVSEVGQ